MLKPTIGASSRRPRIRRNVRIVNTNAKNAAKAKPIAVAAEINMNRRRYSSKVLNDLIRELRALDLLRAFHQSREVIRDGLVQDRFFQPMNDRVGGFLPAEIF